MSASNVSSVLQVDRVVETCINVDDVARARKFYESVFSLEVMYSDERLCEVAIGNSVLMLFARGQFTRPVTIPGGVVPAHDTSGAGHVAFAISSGALPAWRARLRDCDVKIESEVHWERGGTSLTSEIRTTICSNSRVPASGRIINRKLSVGSAGSTYH